MFIIHMYNEVIYPISKNYEYKSIITASIFNIVILLHEFMY